MEKEEGYSIFLDTSGSVGNSQNYWSTVQDVHILYANKISHYYFWNSALQPIDKKRYEKAIEEKKGWAGTNPHVVAQKVVKDNLERIILITDGQVDQGSVQRCDKTLQKNNLKEVICYIIASSGSEVNMSVTCPFTRGVKSQVFTKLKNQPMQTLANYTPQDFKMLDKLDEITLDNFDEKYQLLENLIIALNMGKEGNIPLKNQIVVMKNRLVKEYSKRMSTKSPIEALQLSLQENNLEKAIEYTKQLTQQYYGEGDTTTFEKKVSHLINLCGDLRGKYSIKEIKSNKMPIAKNALEGKLDKEVQTADLSKNPIECPIILDEDVPQILIDEGEPLLLGVEKNIVDDIVACPLRILNYPEIKQKFKLRLSNYIGVKHSEKIVKNPFTQNILLGAIPLGTHPSHVKVGNYTLAKMISGGKILGNLNMYYAVVWYLIRQGNIQYLKQILPNAEQHLIFRLKNSKTMISLCGLSQFVTTEVTTDVAVWYCVNSGFLNQKADRDTLRFHIFNMDPLIAMLQVLKMPIIKGTQEHIRRTKLLFNMLSRVKKYTTEQKKSFKCIMQCLYQKGMFIDANKVDKQFGKTEVTVAIVPVDGPADEAQVEKIMQSLPQNWKKSPIEQIHYISTKVDPQLSASDIFLDFNLTVPPLPKFQVNWEYKLVQYPYMPITICPKTLRPLYNIGNLTWQQEAFQKYQVKPQNMLKGCKYFEQFILKHKRRPATEEQFAIFLYNRYIESGKIASLPYLTQQWCGDLIKDYDNEVKKIIEASMPIPQRVIIQKQ